MIKYVGIADPRLLPCILIFIDVCAAISYATCGDWRRVVYWLAAAVLTVTVTF